MQRAKSFFLVCAGIFLLALAYHFGATSATAQAPGNSAVTARVVAGGRGQRHAAAHYRTDLPDTLMKKVKIAESVAAATALAKIPGGAIHGVELEEERGKLIYSYDIRVAGEKGNEEVNVDAISGAVVGVEHETPMTEKKKPAEDRRGAKRAPAPVKKP
jgi:uncharacterized membrane protein YkoI